MYFWFYFGKSKSAIRQTLLSLRDISPVRGISLALRYVERNSVFEWISLKFIINTSFLSPFPHQIFNLLGSPNGISFYSTARFSHFIDSIKLYSNRNLYSINNNFQVFCCFFVYKLVLYIHYIKNGLARLVRERNLWAKNAPIRVRNLAAIL